MKFSVLLPTRNRLEYLRYAITSVLEQNYEDWEIIISDNDSEEKIEEYVISLQDQRIKYFRTQSFLPVTDNWNNALEKSSGDYVVMLGDDDSLLKDYFTNCLALIQQYDSPDMLYVNALLYAYPNVLPNAPNGHLARLTPASFMIGKDAPFILNKTEALRCVNHVMNFTVMVNFNMQHTLVSRRLINQMAKHGKFYQSPYPDYYATTAILAKADRVLVVPSPMVVIGISPKSFGYYYFNSKENDGLKELKNSSEMTIYAKISKYFLPGTNMNTSWLQAMESVKQNFSSEFPLKVNYKKYRFLQMLQSLKNYGCSNHIKKRDLIKLIESLFWWEIIPYMFLVFTTISLKICLPKNFRTRVLNKLSGMFSHPRLGPATYAQGNYKNMLEVFHAKNLF